jgi:hypothetical protein
MKSRSDEQLTQILKPFSSYLLVLEHEFHLRCCESSGNESFTVVA